ncbi:NAD(P)-dependent alcohol dehydrogenase [Lapillicoccus jejuensis]|uniref:alcohol dehydrogenase (NADP(+)) n=1 Tax=Lapillicoccus jejuensis TaxID=402171 RepID=A0A542DW66_9MICO|nr:NAD(P)-dependent alcohol dehydrogenase [Lapillicoccus jejuensis]TQJ07338.1 putative zinc-type alcohol dehydrogenase-like protein [Lapillicoccus jejuensis]
MSIAALAARQSGGPLEPATYEPRALRDDDIRIDVKFAGICHSDIHTVREEWGSAIFPLVPGHEIAGVVAEVGSAVTKYKVGDRVGVGCMVDSCGECEYCKDGQEQFCAKGMTGTYNARDRHDKTPTKGGYAQAVTVSERFAVRIPDGLELDVAAPLLCAGITTYEPLRRFKVGQGTKVAVVGLGGLGHMGVKLAVAMGADVTVLSRSQAKKDDALALGAQHYVATGEEGAFKGLRSSFDLVLNTVSADLDMNDYLATLKPLGALVNVGLPTNPYEVAPFSVVGGSRILAGSNIGGIPATQEMLDFCAEHHLGADIETIDAKDVNEAYDRVVAGDVRYRVVIDTATIPTDGEKFEDAPAS